MLSTISQLQHAVNGTVVTLLCDCNIALVDLKEALFQFQKFVGQVEDNSKAAAAAAKPTASIVSETPVVNSENSILTSDIQPVQ